jgi:hypothetical protein
MQYNTHYTSGSQSADSKAAAAASDPKGYKQQKEQKRKERSEDSSSWNAAFLRGDAVIDTLAERLGVGKGEVCSTD